MFAATQPTPIRPMPGVGFAHCKRAYRVKYEKATPLCKHFSTSESAPNTPHTKSTLTTHQKRRAQTNTPIMPQKPRSASKYAIPKAHPSQRKQDGKKTNPDTLTDDKNTPDTPQANLYRQRREPMQTEYPHRINARRSKNCVSIDRQNCFTKSVKQARKNIWTRRKTPFRASAWAVACYGTLFANMCIIRAYLEIIWLDFDRSCPYCSL